MNVMHLPIDIVHLLEDRLGREEGRKVAEAIEAGLSQMEAKSREMANLRKIEAKAELKQELREELATKEDLAKAEGSLREEIARVEGSLREKIAQGDASLREEILRVEGSLGERMAKVEGRLEGIERFLKESVATKAELTKLEAKVDNLVTKLEARLLWLTTIFLIVFLNQNALEFIARLFGLVK